LPDPRFLKIDDSNRGDHYYLSVDDVCYYVYEYTPGAGFTGDGNQLIVNLKKKMDRKARPDWKYKGRAIRTCTAILSANINEQWLRVGTLVPVPPSKAQDDPMYDDRIAQVLRGIQRPFAVDIRELVRQSQSTRASHESEGDRLSPDELEAVYSIDEAEVAVREPAKIAVVDDMLTTGAHFVAMKRVLSRRFPRASIVGIFITRRVLPRPDFPDVADLVFE